MGQKSGEWNQVNDEPEMAEGDMATLKVRGFLRVM